MEAFVLILLSLAFLLLFSYFNSKTVFKKAQAKKKSEIIDEYKNELLKIYEKHKDNEEVLKSEKLEFLKKVNKELSMNIFFEKDEAKKVLEYLVKMEQKWKKLLL